MQVTLTEPDLQKFIEEEVAAGRFPSAQALIEAAVARLMLEGADDQVDEETLAAIDEGNAQIDGGQGIDLDRFAADMRKKHTGQPGEGKCP